MRTLNATKTTARAAPPSDDAPSTLDEALAVIERQAAANQSLRFELEKARKEKAAFEAELRNDFAPLKSLVPADRSITYNTLLVAAKSDPPPFRVRKYRSRYYASKSSLAEWLRMRG
jgi:hypothetical protein